MTKGEIIQKIAADASISLKSAQAALESIMSSIRQGVQSKNGKITLIGFGTFYKYHRKACRGHHPGTGKLIHVRAINVVKFRPGKVLKRSI